MKQKPIIASDTMKKIYNDVMKIASFPTTVLIEGETGVGKELIAELIHQSSTRANMPFVKINCGAIPETLLETDLFGYERNTFNMGNRDGNSGLLESAHKGSLFLDEIGHLSNTLQLKLLRVLQEHEARCVGGSWSRPIDVRIIASTNTNLLDQVKNGNFRMDLYYRLNVFNIKIPPLRERTADIMPLIEYFLNYFSTEYGCIKKFDKHSLSVVSNYRFYGNIRELRNIVESAYINSVDELIKIDSLPQYIINCPNPLLDDTLPKITEEHQTLPLLLDFVEREAILKAVSSSASIRKAASILGISNATMLRRIKYHGLKFDK